MQAVCILVLDWLRVNSSLFIQALGAGEGGGGVEAVG